MTITKLLNYHSLFELLTDKIIKEYVYVNVITKIIVLLTVVASITIILSLNIYCVYAFGAQMPLLGASKIEQQSFNMTTNSSDATEPSSLTTDNSTAPSVPLLGTSKIEGHSS